MANALAALGFTARAKAKAEDPWWLSSPSDPYPLDQCVVCDSDLDENSEFLDFDGREIRVCGNLDCGAQFSNETDRWMAEVDQKIVEQEKPFYPLTTCVVTGDSLETVGAVDFILFNRLFLLSGETSCDAVQENPEKYFSLLNKAVIEKQKSNYPLDKCIVSEQPLGEKAIDYVVANQLVRLANEEQIEAFDKMAGIHLAKLRKLTKEKAGAVS